MRDLVTEHVEKSKPRYRKEIIMKLYRVRTKTYRNQGRYKQQHGTQVRYCGYDRDEAIRIYFENKGEDECGSRSHYGTKTVFEALDARRLPR